MNNRLINTKVAGGGGGCTDIVDNYDPFDGNGVALYQLNGNALDSSPNAYNGTWSGTEAYGTGVFGQAGVFNGSSSAINTTYTPTVANLRTVSFWFKTTATAFGVMQSVGPYGVSSNYNWEWIYMLADGKIGAGYGANNGGAVYMKTTNSSYNDNSWHHLALTLNGVYGVGSFVQLYIDGVEVSVSADTTYSGSISAITGTFRLGHNINAGVPANIFNGSIDQVRIFNTALDPLEIEALYTEELCICDGTVDTLDILGDGSCIATYQLDGNANDLSGNYSGTPTNVSYGVGEFDLAGVFNGSAIQLPTGASSFNNKSFSLWFKYDYNSQDSFSFMFGDDITNNVSPYNGIQIWSNYSNNNNLTVRTKGGNELNILQPQNRWYHLCVTYDRVSAKIYIDGSYVNQISDTTDLSSVDAISMGANPYDSTKQNYVGELDQVRIFNKALNSSEVTTLYNETACTKVTRTAGATQILGDSSCVAYYKLDGDVTDETNTYNGSVVGAISYADGEFDYAADFDYSNNYINTNCPLLWDNVQGNITPITISCWIKGQGYSGTNLGWIAMAGYFAYIAKTPNNEIQIQTITNTGGSLNLIKSNAILNNTDWFHIVGIWNFKTIKLYINGQFIGEDTGTNGFSGDQQITKNILIGKWNLTSQNAGYLGEIDQFRIFNKEVSPSEVTTLYNEGI